MDVATVVCLTLFAVVNGLLGLTNRVRWIRILSPAAMNFDVPQGKWENVGSACLGAIIGGVVGWIIGMVLIVFDPVIRRILLTVATIVLFYQHKLMNFPAPYGAPSTPPQEIAAKRSFPVRILHGLLAGAAAYIILGFWK